MEEKENKPTSSKENDGGKKANRKGFIVLGVFIGVAALLITVSTIGAFARQIAGTNKGKTYLSWTTTAPGFYDEDKRFLKKEDESMQGSFSFKLKEDSSEEKYYSVSNVETPKDARCLVFPSKVNNVVIKEILKAENQNIFAKTTYSDEIEAIYFKSFYFRIGENSLRGMSSLKVVSFASSGTARQTLADYALADNPSLKNVSPAKTLAVIGDGTFKNDTGIAHLEFQDTVLSSIGDYAFENTSKLESLRLPSSVTSIGSGFLKGSALTKIDYDGTKKEFQGIALKDGAFEGSAIDSIHCQDGTLTLDLVS